VVHLRPYPKIAAQINNPNQQNKKDGRDKGKFYCSHTFRIASQASIHHGTCIEALRLMTADFTNG